MSSRTNTQRRSRIARKGRTNPDWFTILTAMNLVISSGSLVPIMQLIGIHSFSSEHAPTTHRFPPSRACSSFLTKPVETCTNKTVYLWAWRSRNINLLMPRKPSIGRLHPQPRSPHFVVVDYYTLMCTVQKMDQGFTVDGWVDDIDEEDSFVGKCIFVEGQDTPTSVMYSGREVETSLLGTVIEDMKITNCGCVRCWDVTL